MSLRLLLAERWLPGSVRRRMLRDLAQLCAGAFNSPAPDLRRLVEAEAIRAFAVFTRDAAARVIAGEDRGVTVRDGLHRRGREMGASIRRRLGVRTPAEAARVLRVLYRGIGIDFDADASTGAVTIHRCAFSAVYTPAVCRIMSWLDAGIADGVTGGAALVFDARITEGAPCCRGRLTRAFPS